MAETKTLQRLRDLRQMRLGQNSAEIVKLPSAPEIEFALVPLTESEISDAMKAVGRENYPENVVGLEIADRVYNQEVLIRAIREPGDLIQRVFSTVEEFKNSVQATDTNILIDKLGEISLESAGLEGLSEEEVEELKKLLERIKASELSIKQAYALKRSLLTLRELHPDNGVGSG